MADVKSQNTCPFCYTVDGLVYNSEDNTYKCEACGQSFAKTQIDSNVSDSITSYISDAIRNTESPDSAIVYLETYFSTFDWDTYNKSADIFIEDLKIMVEKNKIKNAINPKTWELEFDSLVMPLQKKLEGLTAVQEKIAEKYQGDISAVTEEVAAYTIVNTALVENREAILKILNSDVANMAKQGSAAADVTACKKALADLEKSLNSLTLDTEVDNMPVVKKINAEKEVKLVAEFKTKSIDAVTLYEQGVMNFKNGDYGLAINCFGKIRGFRDVNRYINDINSVFTFSDIVEVAGKKFKIAPHKVAPLAIGTAGKDGKDAKNAAPAPAAPAEEEGAYNTKDLFEIIGSAPSKDAAVKSISEIVCNYGKYIYYIKNNREFCVYDVDAKSDTVLDTSKYGYHTDDQNSFGYSFDRKKIYIKKVLEIDAFKAKGCFKFFTKKRQEEEYKKSQQNNYMMIFVDLEKAELTSTQFKMISCVCVRDYIFYKVSEAISEDKKHRKTYANFARVYNIASGKIDTLFQKNCEILGVIGKDVIYDFWVPNSLNREIRAINFETKKDILIEENVYKVVGLREERIYYKVGNKKLSPLYSIKPDGTDRAEISMNYSGDSVDVSNGWVYIARGNSRIKVSVDGKKRLVIARDVKNAFKYYGNYMYYISTKDEFKIAKVDGTSIVKVADNMAADQISIGVKYIYFLRKEWVGDEYSKSLYRMGFDGHNIKKIIFDVITMKDKNAFNENAPIYVKKVEYKDFHIKTAAEEWTEAHKITSYYAMNKMTGELSTILELGRPDPANYQSTAKKGCLSKKKVVDPIIEEVPVEIDYGQFDEEPGEAMVTNNILSNILPASNNSNNSNNGGIKGKLSGLLNKFKK